MGVGGPAEGRRLTYTDLLPTTTAKQRKVPAVTKGATDSADQEARSIGSLPGRFIAVATPILVLMVVANAALALTITTAPITFPGITLNGADQTVAGSTSAWRADATGEAGGWNVTVASTDFTDGGSGTIAVPNFEVRLLDTDIVVVSGSPTGPVSTQTVFAALSATPLKIASAASGTGDGVYDMTPGFRLTVPAEVLAGSYTATVTIAIGVGP